MLHLYFGTTATVFLTLLEAATLDSPHFLFVFTQRVPNADTTVGLVLTPAEITDRSEKFIIDVDTVFSGQKPGQWSYQVYEQASDSNTDVSQTGKELERGIVQLHKATADAFAYTQRQTTTKYIQPT